jgi:hypothetical protein
MLPLTMLTTGIRMLLKMTTPTAIMSRLRYTPIHRHLGREVRRLSDQQSPHSSSSSKRRHFLRKQLINSIVVQRLALNDVILLVIFEAFQQSVLEYIA